MDFNAIIHTFASIFGDKDDSKMSRMMRKTSSRLARRQNMAWTLKLDYKLMKRAKYNVMKHSTVNIDFNNRDLAMLEGLPGCEGL